MKTNLAITIPLFSLSRVVTKVFDALRNTMEAGNSNVGHPVMSEAYVRPVKTVRASWCALCTLMLRLDHLHDGASIQRSSLASV